MKTLQKDLTTGNPGKIIFNFTLPIFIGNVFQQFYSMADTIIVGKFVGTKALAAVGSTGTIMFLINGFILGMTAGFTVLTAQKFGAGDMKAMRKTVGNAAILAIIMSLIMTVLGMMAMKPLLGIMKTPDDIFKDAYAYIMVICGGIAAQMLYNFLSSVLRALGNSKVPLYFLILAALLNIVLDMVFIIAFHMGAAGAAWATVISQGISGILCLIYMYYKFDILIVKKDEWKADTHLMRILCSMGVPMGLQYSITAIGSVILQTAVNTLGSAAVAAMTAGSKVSLFFCCPFDALGSTMSTYGGQNVGAKRLDRIGKGLLSCSILGIVYSIAAFVILYFFGDKFALMFLDAGETEILQNARMMLVINSAFFIPLTFVNVIRFLIQGMGYSTFAILAGVFEMIARTLGGVFLVPVFGYTGACFASPLAWILADLFLFPAYFHVMKRLHKILKV